VLSVLLHSFMPTSTAKLLDALGADEFGWSDAPFAATGGGRSVAALEPLFPKR
jgi:methionyl-tRNA synthetase